MIHNATMISAKIIIKNFFLIKIFIIYLLLISNGLGKESGFLEKGKEYFQKKEFDKSKVLFERDLVFNPQSEISYLYLAKIFEKRDNDEEQEINLKNVLLLNPKNDEAIYMLTILKIKHSDYDEAKELMDKFILVCNSFCSKKNEMQKKFEKLTPENEKSNN